jgi:hypothetical protein
VEIARQGREAIDAWRRAHPDERLDLAGANLAGAANITERCIGRYKIRARVVRGFKGCDGALNFFALTQALTS